MLKKRFLKVTFFLILTIVLNLFVIKYAEVNFNNKLELTLLSLVEDSVQVFYDENTNWSEEKSQKQTYNNLNEIQTFEFLIPEGTKNLRIDFGDLKEDAVLLSANLKYFNRQINILEKIEKTEITNDINNIIQSENSLTIKKLGNDSFVVIDINKEINELTAAYSQKINVFVKTLCLIFINLVILILGKKRKTVFSIIREIYENKTLVWNLAKNDFKTKYAGSYLGIFWAFINPVVTILIYWFVFEFGLKAGAPIPNVPFILWFTAGLIPWFFFSDAIVNATNSFIEYSYLVKKVVFKISILPIVKIISSMFIHLVFVGFIIIIFAIYGRYPNIYMLQLIYYSICIFILSLAIVYATSAIILFFKDLGQIIGLLLQVGMWMTPIMWSYTIIPQKFQWIVKLNPMFYIVDGYRNILINKTLFFHDFWGTMYFWSSTVIIFVVGMVIFKKLKPHFSDVL